MWQTPQYDPVTSLTRHQHDISALDPAALARAIVIAFGAHRRGYATVDGRAGRRIGWLVIDNAEPLLVDTAGADVDGLAGGQVVDFLGGIKGRTQHRQRSADMATDLSDRLASIEPRSAFADAHRLGGWISLDPFGPAGRIFQIVAASGQIIADLGGFGAGGGGQA